MRGTVAQSILGVFDADAVGRKAAGVIVPEFMKGDIDTGCFGQAFKVFGPAARVLEFDIFGDRSSSALLLIAGNGAQLLFWDAGFCELLAKTGLFVIRFDNRDAGLSTKFDFLRKE
ncbi:hypothetical protein [Sporomusa ovata]|uniref:hypothetical protein n=1 Tax=Sporomusa ovata TaxID=2378 RepID=UPI001F23B1B3|nr:hypothetical protein [Sporomusa ovata]